MPGGGRPRLPAHCFSGPLLGGGLGPHCTSTDFRNGGGRCRSRPRHRGRRGHRGREQPKHGPPTSRKRQTLLDRFPPPTSRIATCSQTPCGKREMRFTSPRPRAQWMHRVEACRGLVAARLRGSLMIGQRKDFARGHRNELNGRGEGMDHGASKTPPWTDFRPPTGEDTWSYIYPGLCRFHSKSH